MTILDVATTLPEITVLAGRCQALATLDAIMSPDPEFRYYGFTCRWAPGQRCASMDNGSGDAWSIVFCPDGAFIRGFAHESAMSPAVNDEQLWPGLVDTVPDEFAEFVDEPAFSYEGTLEATVCLWRRYGDDRWHTGDITFPDGADPDGAHHLFAILIGDAVEAYRGFAEDNYGTTIDVTAVDHIVALRPLTDDIVQRLNPDITLADLADDLAEIGYPSEPA